MFLDQFLIWNYSFLKKKQKLPKRNILNILKVSFSTVSSISIGKYSQIWRVVLIYKKKLFSAVLKYSSYPFKIVSQDKINVNLENCVNTFSKFTLVGINSGNCSSGGQLQALNFQQNSPTANLLFQGLS